MYYWYQHTFTGSNTHSSVIYCFHNPKYSKAVWTVSMIVSNQKPFFALFLLLETKNKPECKNSLCVLHIINHLWSSLSPVKSDAHITVMFSWDWNYATILLLSLLYYLLQNVLSVKTDGPAYLGVWNSSVILYVWWRYLSFEIVQMVHGFFDLSLFELFLIYSFL